MKQMQHQRSIHSFIIEQKEFFIMKIHKFDIKFSIKPWNSEKTIEVHWAGDSIYFWWRTPILMTLNFTRLIAIFSAIIWFLTNATCTGTYSLSLSVFIHLRNIVNIVAEQFNSKTHEFMAAGRFCGHYTWIHRLVWRINEID